MPAPPKDLMATLTKASFMKQQILLPIKWASPKRAVRAAGKELWEAATDVAGGAWEAVKEGRAVQGVNSPLDMFSFAFKADERSVAPTSPLNLFREPTPNKYHVDTSRIIGAQFETYIDGICGAVCDGIGMWLAQVSITGVTINGPVGLITPGSVVGPPLAPLITASAPAATAMETKYSNAIAAAFGAAWSQWAQNIMGILTYPPTFLLCSAPVHPPTPNIPKPLLALPSAGEAKLAPGAIASSMESNFGDDSALHAAALFHAIGRGFYPAFTLFKTQTTVQNVLGTGPVPTFAPPFVPVGPVVGGMGMGAPGCLV